MIFQQPKYNDLISGSLKRQLGFYIQEITLHWIQIEIINETILSELKLHTACNNFCFQRSHYTHGQEEMTLFSNSVSKNENVRALGKPTITSIGLRAVD
jgi:hypothetical protein